jgi:hypothetical protein
VLYRASGTNTLTSVDASGGTIDFGVNAPAEIASPLDIDGDPELEVAYIGGGDAINVVDRNGDTQQLAVPGNTAPLGAGTFDGSDVVVYVNGNNELATVDGSGTSSEIVRGKNNRFTGAQAVAGVANVDDDSQQEIYYVESGPTVAYVDNAGRSGNLKKTSTGVSIGSSSGAISNPADFGFGTGAEVAIKNGNGNIEIVGSGGVETTISLGVEPQATPLGAYDYVGDGTPEVVFTDGNSRLRYATLAGSVGFVTDSDGNRITVESTPGVSG